MDGAAHLTLILGGARSGKSRYAEELAIGSGLRKVYLAPAEAFDDEMAERIARHRADRGDAWQTVDCPIDLADAISTHNAHDTVLLVDCLTLWLSNVMLADRDIGQDVQALAHAASRARGRILFVSNEVGQGIVPDNPLARRFRDEAGRLNQEMARLAFDVWLVTAGLPLRLK